MSVALMLATFGSATATFGFPAASTRAAMPSMNPDGGA